MPSHLDSELAAALARVPLDALPRRVLDFTDLSTSRERLRASVSALLDAGAAGDAVEAVDGYAPGAPGGPDVRVRCYRPFGADDTALPCLYWIHGGGMVSGSIEAHDGIVRSFVTAASCAAVSVGYRLPPEHPHPAPVEDCYAGFRWVAEEATTLGIDASRIAVGGASAGGGLAAATVLRNKHSDGPPVAFQFLIQPMLDDRNETASSHEVTALGIWDRDMNIRGWQALLGDAWGTDAVPADAAPARATDLAGLPPTFIDVGTAEVFRDEVVTFAHRLMLAGVPTELHVYPGAFHGWDAIAPAAAISQTAVAVRVAALRRAFAQL